MAIVVVDVQLSPFDGILAAHFDDTAVLAPAQTVICIDSLY